MEQEKFEIWMMEYLSSELDESRKLEFEKYLQDHPKHKEEFDVLSGTWHGIGELKIPEASEEMDTNFFTMLNAEIELNESSGLSWIQYLKSIFGPIRKPQLTFGVLVLAIGLWVGYMLGPNDIDRESDETIVSNNET